MKPIIHHSWPTNVTDAINLQNQLAKQIITNKPIKNIKTIAGVDVAYDKHSDRLIAAVVVMLANNLEVIETTHVKDVAQFPYIPGLFSFREIPPLIKALAKLKKTVDLIVCDAQGIAHPRRFGLACHLGLLFDIPTIGCGKTKLIGEPQGQLSPQRGSSVNLVDNREVIGKILRTQDNINPVFVSVGHKVDLHTACQWLLNISPQYRLPETTRQADQLVKKLLKA